MPRPIRVEHVQGPGLRLSRLRLSFTNFDPRSLPILSEAISNGALQLRLRPRSLIENPVVPCNPKDPESGPPEELPELAPFVESSQEMVAKKSVFKIKRVKMPTATRIPNLVEESKHIRPRLSGLDAIPEPMRDALGASSAAHYAISVDVGAIR
jgi:hypothetical protein